MRQAFRAAICHCLGDPGEDSTASAFEFFDDAILLVEDGRVAALGPADQLLPALGDTPLTEFAGRLIVPGFVDCHVHFPQIDLIASYGEQLLDWLERYAYPAEQRFADADYAAATAALFLDELLANGTTTACVFATVHPQSAEALFAAAHTRGMRLIAGKVLMDRNCPARLQDDPASAYRDSLALLERWHGKGRLGYAITPRFALSSSEEQLAAAGRLAREHPDVWIHTHLAENHREIRAVAQQFPWSSSYLDVYEQFGLLRERAVFAHCLHLAREDVDRLGRAGAAAAFCPTSNLFLGSGLFDLRVMREAAVRVGLGTDVGAGTSLSLFATAADAYKVLQLQGQSLPAAQALYLATLGAARALYLDTHIGNFVPGKEADFLVLDPAATTLGAHRDRLAETLAERLFALFTLGDDRHVQSTFLQGKPARPRGAG